MPSGPDYGVRYGDADFFSPPTVGPGGGTGRGGRRFTEER